MRTARLNESGAGLRVVDEVRTLEVETARSEIADFDCSGAAELLLKRGAPLLVYCAGAWS